MSLHNLATVFGPTLLRPSEKDSKIPTNPTQPISMGDSWSLEVMSQVGDPAPSVPVCRLLLRLSLLLLSVSPSVPLYVPLSVLSIALYGRVSVSVPFHVRLTL